MKICVPVALLFGLAACQPTIDEQRIATVAELAGGDPRRGLDVADRNFSLCHAIARDGTSPLPQAPAFRTLSARCPLDALTETLAEGIVVGHTGMPQIRLEPQKTRDLIAYLETIQTRPAAHPN